MAKGYQIWVGVVLGLLVLAAALLGATKLLGGDNIATDADQLGVTTDEASAEPTTQIAGAEPSPDLQSFADSEAADPMAPEASSGAALRVVVDPATIPEVTSSSSTTIATTASTAAPESTTTTAEATTTTAESTTTVIPSTEATVESTTTTETPTTTAEVATTAVVSGDARSFEQQVISLTNEARAANGCPPLTHNDKLQAAALGHSKDMYEKNYFDHKSLDGSEMSDRIDRQGYQWRRLAENIAAGYRTPSSVVDGWMNSSGHRANILNCDLAEIGVGFHSYYWTQNFGTPR